MPSLALLRHNGHSLFLRPTLEGADFAGKTDCCTDLSLGVMVASITTTLNKGVEHLRAFLNDLLPSRFSGKGESGSSKPTVPQCFNVRMLELRATPCVGNFGQVKMRVCSAECYPLSRCLPRIPIRAGRGGEGIERFDDVRTFVAVWNPAHWIRRAKMPSAIVYRSGNSRRMGS